MKTGVELIAQERKEQIQKHLRNVSDDVRNNNEDQLSFAAALLSAPDPMAYANAENAYGCPHTWDPAIWERMIKKPYKERLIIAGALLAAELDRINAISDDLPLKIDTNKIDDGTYRYQDLMRDLSGLNDEEYQRPVILWREDSGMRIGGLNNDRQPYYHIEDEPDAGVISATDLKSLDPEDQKDYTIFSQNGVTALWEDF